MNRIRLNVPKIIQEAARSPLGLLALVVVALAVLAFSFFYGADERIRFAIFLILFLGASLFSAKAFQIASKSRGEYHEQVNRPSRERQHPALEVVARSEDFPPFAVDAVVVEDDTYMVLSADPEFKATGGSVGGIVRDASRKYHEPGSVVVQQGDPLRLLAIVHDLSKEPTWREEWVARALANVLNEADYRELKAIAIPPLGTKYGSLGGRRFVELFVAARDRIELKHLKKVWFVLPASFSREALEVLTMKPGI